MSKLNHHSILLSDEENQSILSCLAVGETSLSTTVVQLVLTTPPDHNQWQMFGTGVMCFVKNNRKRTYFFRLYDFDQKLNVWEQEIYLDIKYVIAEPMFHMFEAETCMAGISFIEPTEANYFCDVVQQKAILLKRMLVRSESKVEVSQDIARENQDRTDHLQVPDISPIRSLSLDTLSSKKRFSFKVKSKKKSKTKISKLDIGLPTNFKHVQHIGWSPSTGFDFNVIDPMLDNFFKLAGISDQHLSDVDTRKFIFDFIDSHGGIETAIKEAKQPTHDNQLSKQVESSMGKTTKLSKLTKEQPTIARITRSSSPTMPPPPPPPIMGADSNGSCVPPPPPPPPPPSLVPPNNINTVDSNDKSSESLLNIDSNKKNNSENSCGRDQLLQQIRGGISLKKIERSQESTDRSGENKANPLASALSEALQNRFRVNQSVDLSSDESDDNKDNDEVYFNEWSE